MYQLNFVKAFLEIIWLSFYKYPNNVFNRLISLLPHRFWLRKMGARRPTNKNNYKLNPNEGTETETIIDDNPDS